MPGKSTLTVTFRFWLTFKIHFPFICFFSHTGNLLDKISKVLLSWGTEWVCMLLKWHSRYAFIWKALFTFWRSQSIKWHKYLLIHMTQVNIHSLIKAKKHVVKEANPTSSCNLGLCKVSRWVCSFLLLSIAPWGARGRTSLLLNAFSSHSLPLCIAGRRYVWEYAVFEVGFIIDRIF